MANNPFKQLDVIRKTSAEGRPIKDCYRLMYKRSLWEKAYAKLAPNPGNLTPGTNNETIDGFRQERIDAIIEQLREERFRFSSVKRIYIAKTNGKQRPLGIPNFKDKLVQEVMRMILENIYEPVFSENSHGFRPKRSCHTALSQLKCTWSGVKWCIEGDISGFFDNIDHKILLSLLGKKIKDHRFLRLVHNALKCGYLENWKHFLTYSGTPQGSIVSPVLANVYLHELDLFIETLKSEYEQGNDRCRYKEYQQIKSNLAYRKQQVTSRDNLAKHRNWEGRSTLIRNIRDLKKSQRNIPALDPFDPNYKRLKYVRYADDFVIGVIGSKQEAVTLKAKVKEFLKTVNLELSEKKTRITHIKKPISFLGYQFRRWHGVKVVRVWYKNRRHPQIQRTLSGKINLEIPREKLVRYAKERNYGNFEMTKSSHRTKLINHSEVEILFHYNAELRGFANYYRLASNYHHLNRLFFIAEYSFLKTLANKRQSSVSKVAKDLRRYCQGELALPVKNKIGEKIPRKLVKLKHLPKQKGPVKVDSPKIDQCVNIAKYSGRTELEKKLTANQCEACGTRHDSMEVHHVRKLEDLRKKRHLGWLDLIMIERQRKTLILCHDCHRKHHKKQIPLNQLESVVL